MSLSLLHGDVGHPVRGLNITEKVEHSLRLVREARAEFDDRVVVANGLGKDPLVLWELAMHVRRLGPDIGGFAVTTSSKLKQTKEFMHGLVSVYPELRVFENAASIPDPVYQPTRTAAASCSRCSRPGGRRNPREAA